jgi:TonB family protein
MLTAVGRRAARGAGLALVVAFALSGAAAAGTPRSRDDAAGAVRAGVFDVPGLPWVRALIAMRLRAAGATVLDSGLTDAAASGAGFDGALSRTSDEWRRIGSVVGADVLALGTGSVVEREADNGSRTWDGFLGLFLVDGRTGKLLSYRGLRAQGPERDGVVERLRAEAGAVAAQWPERCAGAVARRTVEPEAIAAPEVDLVATPDVPGVSPPRFFTRPAPQFTDDADRAHVVATVDLAVTFNPDGSYGPIEVLRWAGFGLDEAAVSAVRACRFFPARRGEKPVAARALLRFNFRFRES